MRGAHWMWGIVVVGAALVGCGGGSSHGTAPAEFSSPTASPPSPTPIETASPDPTPTATVSSARWTSFGPEGGDVYVLVVDPDRPGIVYAGTGNGVWRSTDGARNWVHTGGPVGAGRDERRVVALALTLPSLVFAATSSALFRSPDGGVTWRSISEPIADIEGRFLTFTTLAADPHAGGRLFAATNASVYLSNDAGEPWTAITGAPQSVVGLGIDPTDGRHLLAGLATSGARSHDGGATWSPFEP